MVHEASVQLSDGNPHVEHDLRQYRHDHGLIVGRDKDADQHWDQCGVGGDYSWQPSSWGAVRLGGYWGASIRMGSPKSLSSMVRTIPFSSDSMTRPDTMASSR